MKSRTTLIQFLALTLLIQLLTASLPAASSTLSQEVEYYYNNIQDLSILTSIKFQPTDIDTKLIYHNRTTYEHGWMGALPLDKGYATPNFSNYYNYKFPVVINFTVNQLSVDHAYLKIAILSTFKANTSYIQGSHTLFTGNVSQGSNGNVSDEVSIVFSGRNLDNGSILLDQGLYTLLSNENNTYFSTLSAQLTTVDNTPWNGTASIAIAFHTKDNPELFDLMQTRINSKFQTQYTTISSPSDLPQKITVYWMIGISIFVVACLGLYLIYRRYSNGK